MREATAARVGEAAVSRDPVRGADVDPADGANRSLGGDADVEGRVQPRAERDDGLDEVGAPVRERLGEVPAAAVADEREPPAAAGGDALRPGLDAVERAV